MTRSFRRGFRNVIAGRDKFLEIVLGAEESIDVDRVLDARNDRLRGVLAREVRAMVRNCAPENL
jgi:hypothetical protein